MTIALGALIAILAPSAWAADVPDPQGLSRYNPISFTYNVKSARVQLSFKLRPMAPLALFIGYDQKMIWDLRSESRPILDVNYAPHFFYRMAFDSPLLQRLDLGLYEHLSNGRAGPESRGIHGSYVMAERTDELGVGRLTTGLKLMVMYGIDPETPDFRDYRSPLELRLSFVDFFLPGQEDEELYVYLRPGGKFAHRPSLGAIELGLKVPVFSRPWRHMVFVQAFHGYGESLLSYDQLETSVRIGLAF